MLNRTKTQPLSCSFSTPMDQLLAIHDYATLGARELSVIFGRWRPTQWTLRHRVHLFPLMSNCLFRQFVRGGILPASDMTDSQDAHPGRSGEKRDFGTEADPSRIPRCRSGPSGISAVATTSAYESAYPECKPYYSRPDSTIGVSALGLAE